MEMQTCCIADHTDRIELHLWDTKVFGISYEINNVSTRKFSSDLYVTTTWATQMKDVPALSDPGILTFTVDGEVTTLTGEINGVKVTIRRCCVKCHA